MKRLFVILLDILLIFVSVYVAVYIVRVCDRALGVPLVQRLWPGPMGLLFQPGTEDHWEMRDYSCAEYINALGFRDHETPLKKTAAYRIIAIGDSFTYGWGVNVEDAWCKRLERNLRQAGMDVEVLNLGKPAAGPMEYAGIAEIAVPVLKPDWVIIGCLAGDDLQQAGPPKNGWERLRVMFPNATHLVRYCRDSHLFGGVPMPLKRSVADCRRMYVDTARNLLEQMGPEQRARFDRLEEPIKDAFRTGMLNPWLLNHSTGWPDYFMNTLKVDSLQDQIDWTSKAFKRIKNVTRRYGAETVVVSIPEGFYVNKEAFRNVQRIGFNVAPEMLASNAADEAVEKACEQADLAFHCVTDAFRKHMDEQGLYFELDRHMSAAGNALYADLVTPLLMKDISNAAKPPAK